MVRVFGCTAAAVLLATVAACGYRDARPVESAGGGRDVSRFVPRSLAGTRDGDRMNVRAVYSDGRNELTVDLAIAVGSPTRVQSGKWTAFGESGTVRERSLTFLGGQSGPPSIGGRFDLVDGSGVARYRVAIELQPVERRL